MAARRIVLSNVARAFIRRRAGRTDTRTARCSDTANLNDSRTISNTDAFTRHTFARRHAFSVARVAPLNFNRERPADCY